LEALIPGAEKETEKVVSLGIQTISPNRYQPRKNFDEAKLEELAASLRERGIIQPVIVRSAEGGYELVAGERRLEAAKRVGMDSIPAIVRKVTDREMLELSLIENIQRDDLNALEEAFAYKQLMEEFGLTQEKLAEEVGKDRATIANTVRLLKLPEEVCRELGHDRISRGHAIALLGLENGNQQGKLCRRIVREGLSVRETEVLVKRTLTTTSKRRLVIRKSPELAAIEEKLQQFFGTRVNVKRHRAGGKVEIEYYSDEDLERFLNLLGIKLD
jgi:ParB family chromosome partitioning protein